MVMKSVLLLVLTCLLTFVSGSKMKIKATLNMKEKIAFLKVTCLLEPNINESALMMYISQKTNDGGGFFGVAYDVPEEDAKKLRYYIVETKVDTKGGPSYLRLNIKYTTPDDQGTFECGAYVKDKNGEYVLVSERQVINIKTLKVKNEPKDEPPKDEPQEAPATE